MKIRVCQSFLMIFLCCAAVSPLAAEVFSLWPFGTGNGAQEPSGLLNPRKLWNEKIIVNGRNLTLSMSMVELPLADCFRNLKKAYPDAAFAVNKESLLMERREHSGKRHRVFLLEIRGVYPVLQFSMDLPAEKLRPGNWPADFPLPSGARPVTVMEFPGRNALYGAFVSGYSLRETLSNVNMQLQASGWKSVSGEAASAAGTGEIYLKKDQILIIGFSVTKNGGCTGSIYRRPAK